MSTFWFWLSGLGTITATRLLELTTSTPNKKVLMSYLQRFALPGITTPLNPSLQISLTDKEGWKRIVCRKR